MIAPAHCLLCAGPAPAGTRICGGCLGDLPWNVPACPRCALPQQHDDPCPDCQRRQPPFDHAWAAFRYATPVREAILTLKYHAGFSQGRWLAEAMVPRLATLPRPELLLPVPLHAGRLRRRGYNQAALLARALGRRLQLPMAIDAARRTQATADQIGQSAAARRRNLRGAFTSRRRLDGLHVALVDDVMTTGATLAELARTCRAAGATEISVWVAARTP